MLICTNIPLYVITIFLNHACWLDSNLISYTLESSLLTGNVAWYFKHSTNVHYLIKSYITSAWGYRM